MGVTTALVKTFPGDLRASVGRSFRRGLFGRSVHLRVRLPSCWVHGRSGHHGLAEEDGLQGRGEFSSREHEITPPFISHFIWTRL